MKEIEKQFKNQRKKANSWTLKVALPPSGVLLVFAGWVEGRWCPSRDPRRNMVLVRVESVRSCLRVFKHQRVEVGRLCLCHLPLSSPPWRAWLVQCCPVPLQRLLHLLGGGIVHVEHPRRAQHRCVLRGGGKLGGSDGGRGRGGGRGGVSVTVVVVVSVLSVVVSLGLLFPMHLRARQNNTYDPAVQQHLEWLSFNWKTCFSSSSSSTWIEKAQRGGVLHLGTINGKYGTLKDGKTKNGGIRDNNDKDRATLN